MKKSSPPDYHERVSSLRNILSDKNLSALIVRSTDRFLNEYAPEDESARVWLSGFTGSAGDILVTHKNAFLFVDGRYHLQADRQVDPKLFTVVKVFLGTSLEKAMRDKIRETFPSGSGRIGFEPEKFSVDGIARFRKSFEDLELEFVPLSPSPFEKIMDAVREKTGKIRMISAEMAGGTTAFKLDPIRKFMASREISLWVIQPLDEIAWLTNLRGDELPFQATFKCVCLVSQKSVYLVLPKPDRLAHVQLDGITAVDFNKLEQLIPDAGKEQTAGYDPSSTTESIRILLESSGIRTRT
ncbi:MAG TPA: aminopeptidase P family N-terminal domain-containing protein, partial [Nitrospiria bacterium]|nr:aminopeptidase P family N-terminal domain-containing protein [Nitrospiria bacterium]